MEKTIRTVYDLMKPNIASRNRGACFRSDEDDTQGGGSANADTVDDTDGTDDTDDTDDTNSSSVTLSDDDIAQGITLNAEGIKVDKDGNTVTQTITYLDNSIFKANEAGDLLDDEGDIALTSEEVAQGYRLDAEGNVYDKEGLLISDIENDIESIISKVGVTIVDDKNTPVVYPDSKEGIAQYVQDVHNKAMRDGEAMGTAKLQAMQEEHPLAFDAYQYMVQNNTLEGFNNIVDYSKVVLEPKNEAQLIKLIVEAEVSRGHSVADANKRATMFKDANMLLSEGTTSLKYLADSQRASRKQDQDQRNLQIQKQNEELNDRWNEVKASIDNGKLDSISIPKLIPIRNAKGEVKSATRDDFFKYVSKIADPRTGLSAAQIAFNSLPPNKMMEIYYMLFTGSSVGDAVAAKANTNNTKNTRTKIAKRKVSVSSKTVTVAGKLDYNKILF